MDFDVSVKREERCVQVRVEGEAGLGRVLSLLRVLELDSRDWSQHLVLVDLRTLQPPLDYEGQAQVAGAARRAFLTLRKIAILSAPGGAGEKAGVRLFEDEAAARQWLEC